MRNSVILVAGNRMHSVFTRLGEGCVLVLRVGMDRRLRAKNREVCIRRYESRVGRYDLKRQRRGLGVGISADLIHLRHGPLVEQPGTDVFRWPPQGSCALGGGEFWHQSSDDSGGYVILKLENVGNVAIVAFSPYVIPTLGVDELRRATEPVAGPADTALQDVTHTEVFTYLCHINGFTFIRERRISSGYEKIVKLGQSGDDVLGDAVSEILLLRIARHVVER